MGQLIEIKLGEYRSVGVYDSNGVLCKRGDIVIIEMDKGSEFGKVVSDPQRVCSTKPENACGKAVRLATEGDLRQIVNNQMKSKEALSSCQRKIAESKLDMQLVNAEYSFDSSVNFSDGRLPDDIRDSIS